MNGIIQTYHRVIEYVYIWARLSHFGTRWSNGRLVLPSEEWPFWTKLAFLLLKAALLFQVDCHMGGMQCDPSWEPHNCSLKSTTVGYIYIYIHLQQHSLCFNAVQTPSVEVWELINFPPPRQSPFLKLNFLSILQSKIIKRRKREIQRLWLPAGGMDVGGGREWYKKVS